MAEEGSGGPGCERQIKEVKSRGEIVHYVKAFAANLEDPSSIRGPSW